MLAFNSRFLYSKSNFCKSFLFIKCFSLVDLLEIIQLISTIELEIHKYAFMLICMRTTVDISDDLFIRAKKRAVELHKPLRALIEEGLKLCLSKKTHSAKKPKNIDWVTAEGGLPENLDISNRNSMHEWMRTNK